MKEVPAQWSLDKVANRVIMHYWMPLLGQDLLSPDGCLPVF